MRIVALAVMFAVTGCASHKNYDEKLSEQPAQATIQIQQWVPVGTPVADALRIMEQHHFTCYSTNADSVYFDYQLTDSQFSLAVFEDWIVTLVLNDGEVSGVRVSIGLTGP